MSLCERISIRNTLHFTFHESAFVSSKMKLSGATINSGVVWATVDVLN